MRFHIGGVRPFAAFMLIFGVAAGARASDYVGFHAGRIDTRSAAPLRADALAPTLAADGTSVVVVQFEDSIRPEWIESAERGGVTLHHYLPQNAYVATIEPGRFGALASARGVRWVGAIPAAMKIAPSVYERTEDPLAVNIATIARAESRLRPSGIQVDSIRESRLGYRIVKATVFRSSLESIARIPGVLHIEAQPVYTLHGERAAQTVAGNYPPGGTVPTGPGYAAWLASHGLSGAPGLIVQVQDDGIDQGIVTGVPGTAHPDIIGRIVGAFNATADPLGDSQDGHGQINAGIIMGDATVGSTDAGGYLLGQGVAPMASVYGTKIFRNNTGLFDIGGFSFTDLAVLAHNAGATFSNNSWGCGVPGCNGDYNLDAAEFDALTRDADPMTPGNQQMVYFFSAGNDGIAPNSIGTPGTAKNVITVGAGENTDQDGTDGCGVGPLGANSLRDLINFTSRGPNDDGRLGVTLFSVGTHVQGPAPSGISNGFGVCDRFWPLGGQTAYARSSGTSHSSPTACGAGMVLHEMITTQLAGTNGFTSDPSAALIKAAMTATASDSVGGNDGAGSTILNVPDTEQGWGAANLSTIFDNKDILWVSDQAELLSFSGDFFEETLFPVDPAQPMKFMLAWTDAPGAPFAAVALVNDLDLQVTNGSTFNGNVFSAGFSATGGSPDRLNNLEGVFIQNPVGPHTVRVNAFNIAGDGVPGNATALDQDFALFVFNASLTGPGGLMDILNPEVGCSSTLELEMRDSDLSGSGTAMVTVTTSGGDSEPVQLTETPADSGIFLGSIPTAGGAATASNGTLEVADGHNVTATYNNADDGTGSPSVLTDTIDADCVGLTVFNVRALNAGANSFDVTFDTSEPATATVLADTACGGMVFQGVSPVPVASHKVTVSGLDPCTKYFFRVEAADLALNTAVNDNLGNCFRAVTGGGPVVPVFSEGFESGAGGWSGTGLWHLHNTAVSSCPQANSGTMSFYYGAEPACTYNVGDTFGDLRSPDILVPPDAQLTFFSWDLTENTDPYDQRIVLIDNGLTLQQIAMVNNDNAAWVPVGPIDLSAFAGETVNLIFRFDSIDNLHNSFRGWYVDDIEISAPGVCIENAGLVEIDPDLCGPSVHIEVRDLNAGPGPLTVNVVTGAGDSQQVQVTDPDGDGIFNGSAGFGSLGAPTVSFNGIVEAGVQDLITALYNDANTGGGMPALATDQEVTGADCNMNGEGDECDIAPGGSSTDQNGNGVPDECEVDPTPTPVPCCPGDANNSGSFVDANDFIAVQANFGADNGVGGPGDANCSGSFVDANDFIAVQANFGADCG